MLQATVRNRFTTFSGPPSWLSELKSYFCYTKPGSQFSQGFRSGLWDGKTHMMRWGKVGTGLFLHKKAALLEKWPDMKIVDERVYAPCVTPRVVVGAPPPHEWQKACVAKMLEVRNCGGLVLCATGSGKTFTAGMFLAHIAGTACFCVDELTLLKQAQQDIAAITGEKIGTVGMGVFDPKRITVATVQTLNKHNKSREFRKWFEELSVIIIDEIHVALNRRSIEIVKNATPLAVYGLTATLQMEKDEVAFPALALAGEVVYRYDLTRGQEENILSTGKAIILRYIHNVPRTGTPEQRYRQGIIENTERNKAIVSIATAGVRRGHRVIISVKRIEHLERLDAMLTALKHPHATLSGAHDQHERRSAIRKMESGDVPLILASTIFNKGVNIKTADVLINASADSNANSTQQRVGRIARRGKGKGEFLYIDISDGAPHNGTNPFSKASAARKQALLSLNIPVNVMRWHGDPDSVYSEQQELGF